MGFVSWKKDKAIVQPVKKSVENNDKSDVAKKGGFEKVFSMMATFMPAAQKKQFWDAMKAEGITMVLEPDEVEGKFSVCIRKQNASGEFEVLHKFTI